MMVPAILGVPLSVPTTNDVPIGECRSAFADVIDRFIIPEVKGAAATLLLSAFTEDDDKQDPDSVDDIPLPAEKEIAVQPPDNKDRLSISSSKEKEKSIITTEVSLATEKIPSYGTRPPMSLLQYSRGLLCGTGDGQILTVDMRDQRAAQLAFRPHSAGLADFTVNHEGHAVVSCGTCRCNLQVYADQLLKVYDLRYRKAQCPIKVEMQPAFVRFMPVFNDSLLVASAPGQFQVANFGQNVLGRPIDEALLLSEYDSVKAVDISSNSKLIAFGTRAGLISLTSGSCSDLSINACSTETAFPPVPSYMSMDCVNYDDPRFVISSSEFVTEPLDKTRFSKLSSDWPEQLCSRKYCKTKPVDMSLFTQYPSKFKAELIGRRPSNWGPVWFPY